MDRKSFARVRIEKKCVLKVETCTVEVYEPKNSIPIL